MKTFPFVILGIISFLSQLILIKEFITSFYGNEFFIILILSLWFFWTAIGSLMYQKIHGLKLSLNTIYFTICFFLLTMILFLRILKTKIFMPGEIPDILLSSSLIFIFSGPLCLSLGYLFPFLVNETKINKISKGYFLENLGFFIAGIFFYFFLTKHNIFLTLTFIFLLSGFNLYTFKKANRFENYLMPLILFITGIFLLFFNQKINLLSLQKIYKNEKIVGDFHTYNGNMIITQRENQHNFYYNGEFLYSSENTYSNETKIHIPMTYAAKTNNILLIGNGFGGIIQELKKYSFLNLYYIEIDPELTDILFSYLSEEQKMIFKNINIIKEEPFVFLKKTSKKFDVIILNLPAPSTLNFNRFYSEEFFLNLKKISNENTIVTSQLPYSEGYLNENLKKLNISLYKTLTKVFKNVICLPESENIFIAFDKNYVQDEKEILKKSKNVLAKNIIVNEQYLIYRFFNSRRIQFKNYINKNFNVEENSFYKPQSYIYEIMRNIDIFYPLISNSYLKLQENKILVLILISFLFIFLKLKLKSSLIFSLTIASYTLMAMEIIIIYLFQVLSGNIHHKISLLISFLMISISMGNIIAEKLSCSLYTLQKLACLTLCYEILFFRFLNYNNELTLFISAIIIGLLFGLYFSILSAQYHLKEAGKIYCWDLLGAISGICISGFLLIPFFGIKMVIIFLIFLNLLQFIKIKN